MRHGSEAKPRLQGLKAFAANPCELNRVHSDAFGAGKSVFHVVWVSNPFDNSAFSKSVWAKEMPGKICLPVPPALIKAHFVMGDFVGAKHEKSWLKRIFDENICQIKCCGAKKESAQPSDERQTKQLK